MQEKVALAIKGAEEVIANKHGKGQDRINSLTDAGYDPVVVQEYGNLRLTDEE